MKEIVIRVRRALEIPKYKSLYADFEDFPIGSCMAASVLLGMILTSKGLGEFKYTSASKDGKTHTWLENNEVLIDITADQYSSAYSDVIVQVKYGDFSHLGFVVESRLPIDHFRPCDLAFYPAVTIISDYIDSLS